MQFWVAAASMALKKSICTQLIVIVSPGASLMLTTCCHNQPQVLTATWTVLMGVTAVERQSASHGPLQGVGTCAPVSGCRRRRRALPSPQSLVTTWRQQACNSIAVLCNYASPPLK